MWFSGFNRCFQKSKKCFKQWNKWPELWYPPLDWSIGFPAKFWQWVLQSTIKHGSMTAFLTRLYLSLVSGRSGCDFKNSIFNLVLLAGIFTSCVKAFRSMLHDFTDNKSTSVQVMAWCRQATSHYPRQSWSSSMSSHMASQWTLCHFIKYLKYTNSLLFSTHGPTTENDITGQNKPQQICINIAWDILYVKICAGK